MNRLPCNRLLQRTVKRKRHFKARIHLMQKHTSNCWNISSNCLLPLTIKSLGGSDSDSCLPSWYIKLAPNLSVQQLLPSVVTGLNAFLMWGIASVFLKTRSASADYPAVSLECEHVSLKNALNLTGLKLNRDQSVALSLRNCWYHKRSICLFGLFSFCLLVCLRAEWMLLKLFNWFTIFWIENSCIWNFYG